MSSVKLRTIKPHVRIYCISHECCASSFFVLYTSLVVFDTCSSVRAVSFKDKNRTGTTQRFQKQAKHYHSVPLVFVLFRLMKMMTSSHYITKIRLAPVHFSSTSLSASSLASSPLSPCSPYMAKPRSTRHSTKTGAIWNPSDKWCMKPKDSKLIWRS